MRIAYLATLCLLLGMSFPLSTAKAQLFPYEMQKNQWQSEANEAEEAPNGLDSYMLTGDSDHRAVQFLSSFMLYPSLEVSERYDDNITLSEQNAQSDWITTVEPSLDIRSNWTRHAIRALLSFEHHYYADHRDETYDNASGLFEGTLDIGTDLKLNGFTRYEDHHLDRYSLFTSNQNDWIHRKDWNYGAELAYDNSESPLTARVKAEQTQMDFQATRSDNGRDSDRTVTRIEPRISYQLSPDVAVFVQPAYQSTHFKESRDAAGRDKDNFIAEFMGGVSVSSPNLWHVEIAIGQQGVYFDEASYKDDWVTSIRTRLLWTPTEQLALGAQAFREIIVSDRLINEEIIATGSHMEMRYAMSEAVAVNLNGGYYNAAFERSARKDDNWLWGGGAEYSFNPNLKASTDYTYRTRDSNLPNASFDNNIVTVALKTSL